MELYHVHLLGNYDRLYKEKSEFVIDKDKFNNRLYRRIYDAKTVVPSKRYDILVNNLNRCFYAQTGMRLIGENVNPGEISEHVLDVLSNYKNNPKVLNDFYNMLVNYCYFENIIEDAGKIALAEGINSRERAMEEYRINNCKDLPSRLHSLYACDYEGLGFWSSQLVDSSVELFRIDVFDEPFKSSDDLLPDESLTYQAKISDSYRYFHPRTKDLRPEAVEYLVQGKVKILEKIDEIRR